MRSPQRQQQVSSSGLVKSGRRAGATFWRERSSKQQNGPDLAQTSNSSTWPLANAVACAQAQHGALHLPFGLPPQPGLGSCRRRGRCRGPASERAAPPLLVMSLLLSPAASIRVACDECTAASDRLSDEALPGIMHCVAQQVFFPRHLQSLKKGGKARMARNH